MRGLKTLMAGLLTASVLYGCADSTKTLSPLPQPELESGIRGEQFGIDKNINEATIDQYLGREDTIYRDMRMLKDEADYEAIGGDAWLSGIVEGFEVVPYPYLVNVEGLPPEVGSSYSGVTLFTHDENGYTANYEESMEILEYLFPKDKNIILMCGGGGYAGMTKAMLNELGWDANRIYNAGGFWFYEGNHRFDVKREKDGKTYYDFYKLNYHYIDFDSLHRITELPEPVETDPDQTAQMTEGLTVLSAEELQQKMDAKETFALSVYLPGCSACAKFAPVVKEASDTGRADFYAISLSEAGIEKTFLKEKVKYTPAVAVIREGEPIAVLDAGKDEDIPRFENADALLEWIGTYIDLKEECETACTAFPQ